MSFANENVAADMKPAVGAGAATPVTTKKTPLRGSPCYLSTHVNEDNRFYV